MEKNFFCLGFVLFLFLFLCIPSLVFAYGSPTYNPDKAHPRMWVDVVGIQAKEAANTSEWQALEKWCDSTLGSYSAGAGYQFMNWHRSALNYAACFAATGTESYAADAVVYINAMLNDKNTVGDGLGGDASIQTDSGWTARTLAAVPVARDWIDGSAALTATVKSNITSRLATWITWYGANGYGRADPTDNYYAGYFSLVYSAAISCYGDSGYQSAWLRTARSMWSDVVAIMNDELSDGDWFEGWNYGAWATREYLLYPLAMETAADDERPWGDSTWYADAAKAQLYMLHPSRALMSDDGSWSGNEALKGQPATAINMDYLAETGRLSKDLTNMARWFSHSLTAVQNDPAAWESFLWSDSNATTTTPTEVNMGSLLYLMGSGHATVRGDGWSNTDATFIDVIGHSQDTQFQGERNVGEIKIASRGVPLLVDSDTYQTDSTYANVPTVTGSHTYAPNQEWWHDDVTMSAGESANAYYIKVNKIENAYDGNLGNTPSLAHYSRGVLFVPPDYTFVYDNMDVTTAGTNTVTWQWNFMGTPRISGVTATTTNSTGKIRMTALGGSLSLSSTSMASTRADVYKISVDETTNPKLNQVITVFETMGNSDTPKTASFIDGNNIRGAVIDGTIALFTESATGADITAASYTVDATKHYIADLPASTSITVTRAGATIVDGQSSGSNGVLEFSAASGSAEYVVTAGSTTLVLPPALHPL